MEVGFFHPSRGYWQAIDVSKDTYTVEVEPERVEVDEDGEETVIPAVTRETSQYEELLSSYPDGTVEVPLKPGEFYDWQDGEWVEIPPPSAPVPNEISRRQFYQGLEKAGFITKQEAIAAIQSVSLPAALEAMVSAIPDEDEQFAATMLLYGAATFERNHPLVPLFAASQELSEGEVDDFWRLCASL